MQKYCHEKIVKLLSCCSLQVGYTRVQFTTLMQIKIDENILNKLVASAVHNRRTPTAETNVALRWYLETYNAKPHSDKSRLSQARVTAGQPQRKES